MKKRLLPVLLFAATSAFAQLSVSAPDSVQCDDNFDGVAVFDLTVNDASLLGGLNPSLYSVHYYNIAADAAAGVNPLANPSAYINISPGSETIWARVQENADPSNFGTASFTVIVNPRPATPYIAPVVVYGATGTGTVVLSEVAQQALANYGPNISAGFYETQADAQAGANMLPDVYVSAGGTLWMRVQDENTGCASVTSFTVTVTNINMGDPINLDTCDANNDGYAMFDLTQNDMFVLGDNSIVLYTIAYFETPADAEANTNAIAAPMAYTNSTANSQAVYVRMTTMADATYAVKEFTITVNPVPVFEQVQNIGIIDLEDNGQEETDLTFVGNSILANLDPQNYTISYYQNFAAADSGVPAISDVNHVVTVANEVIWFRVQSTETGCYSIGSFNILLLPSDYTTPAPTGDTSYGFVIGDTLADIELEGENIQWYATDGQAPPPSALDEATLPLTTVLQEGTYYASQTVYGIESVQRLVVTVYNVLSVKENNLATFTAYPNPVKDNLVITNGGLIDSFAVINTLGQTVYTAKVNGTTATVNFTGLNSGIYFVKVQANAGAKTIKVVKE